MAQTVTNAEIMRELQLLRLDVNTLLSYTTGIISHLASIGAHMSELDQSTAALAAAVNDLLANLPAAGDNSALLAQIADLNAQLEAAHADDATDDAAIADLAAQRDALVADAQENSAKVDEVTARVKEAVGPQVNPL